MDRRTLLKGLAALAPVMGVRSVLADHHEKGNLPAKTCRLITQDIAGPYVVDETPMRSDVVEGQAGTPLTLNFQVFDTFSCNPLPGALVSIWHANAEGLYSGVENIILDASLKPVGGKIDTLGQTFLRGMQKTDANGRVSFKTIFPGWYYPRPTHTHVVVSPPDFGEVATTQLYYPAEVCDQAYEGKHYAQRGPNPDRTDSSKDSPGDSIDAEDLWLDLRRDGDGYVASHNLGVTFYGGMFGELPDFYRQS